MPAEHAEVLREYLTLDEPFGPIDAREINDPKALELLFERHNKIYKALHKRPSLVIGRKGSGKTSYLSSVYFDKTYKYYVNLDTSEAFSSVMTSISTISTGTVFPESVRKIWTTVVYIGLFSELRKQLPKQSHAKKLINAYLAKIGVSNDGTLDDVLWQITDIISEHSKDKAHGVIIDILRSFDNTSFQETLDVLNKELTESKSRTVILLDSLDDFQLHTDVVGRAIQGLLKFIGEANGPNSTIDIRFCLPAELYHLFTPLSSNPDKDFKRRLLIHWTAPELVALAAHRLVLFGCSNPQHPLAIEEDLKRVDGHSADILQKIFPNKVTCKLGVDENPIAYVLRHTQLLPRHLLIILNSICDKYKKFPNQQASKLSEEAIRQGIAAVEETLVQEIFTAYRPVYPKANSTCSSCIPELHHKFSIGDLERVFRTHG